MRIVSREEPVEIRLSTQHGGSGCCKGSRGTRVSRSSVALQSGRRRGESRGSADTRRRGCGEFSDGRRFRQGSGATGLCSASRDRPWALPRLCLSNTRAGSYSLRVSMRRAFARAQLTLQSWSLQLGQVPDLSNVCPLSLSVRVALSLAL